MRYRLLTAWCSGDLDSESLEDVGFLDEGGGEGEFRLIIAIESAREWTGCEIIGILVLTVSCQKYCKELTTW